MLNFSASLKDVPEINTVLANLENLSGVIKESEHRKSDEDIKTASLDFSAANIKANPVAEMTEQMQQIAQEKVKTLSPAHKRKNETDTEAISREIKNYEKQQTKNKNTEALSVGDFTKIYQKLQEQIQASTQKPYDFYEKEFTSSPSDDLFDEINSQTKNPPSWFK